MRETEYALEKLKKAWEKLRSGVQSAKGELEWDGVMQRFEFTFELFWKALKVFLAQEGMDARTPKDCLREAFRLGWLENESVYLDMLEDRNKTSHIDAKSTAEEILRRITTSYVSEMGRVLEKLEPKTGNDG
jgi:nucleotidyltransferase substrate binding protein (TIGR01987 family)